VKSSLWKKRIWRSIEKNRPEFIGLTLQRYPSFVLSDRCQSLEMPPAFGLHAITGERLRPLLAFLAENRYRTLTMNEYVERRTLGRRERAHDVLLTFDDGHRSLYTDVFPLLRDYGFCATAYVVPGEIPAVSEQQSWRGQLCAWPAIQEMHASGVVEFQSHSMYHKSIPVSPQVLEFVRPGVPNNFLISDLWPVMRTGTRDMPADQLPLGTPIHDWGSRFRERPAFIEDPTVVADCVEYVTSRGGATFFAAHDWWTRLLSVVRAGRKRTTTTVGFESPEDQRQAILRDLLDSKHLLERMLPGKQVRHFCFPWYRGSELASRISTEAGYVSNAWGSQLPRFAADEALPLAIMRLPPYYLWRLPGRGRRSLASLLVQRFSSYTTTTGL
jgi:hypothetical protein